MYTSTNNSTTRALASTGREKRITVYDGNCPLCSSLGQAAKNIGWLNDNNLMAYHDLPAAWKEKIDPEHFKYEMALIDLNEDQTYYGLQGIGRALEHRFPGFLRMLQKPWFYRVINFLYVLLSRNRYFILSKQPIVCDCEPPFSFKMRFSFIMMMSVLSLLVSSIIGGVFSLTMDSISFQDGLLEFLSWVVPGWTVLFIAIFLLHNDVKDRWNSLAQISIIMFLGTLPWLPILHLLWFIPPFWVFMLGSLTSLILMFRLFIKRFASVRLGRFTIGLWLILMLSSIFIWQLDKLNL